MACECKNNEFFPVTRDTDTSDTAGVAPRGTDTTGSTPRGLPTDTGITPDDLSEIQPDSSWAILPQRMGYYEAVSLREMYPEKNAHPMRIQILWFILMEMSGFLFQDIPDLSLPEKFRLSRKIAEMSGRKTFDSFQVPGESYPARLFPVEAMLKVMAPALVGKNDCIVRSYHLLYSVISIHHDLSFRKVMMTLLEEETLRSLDSYLEEQLFKRNQRGIGTTFVKECPVPGRETIETTMFSLKDIRFLMQKTFEWYLRNSV